jgi:hypothetical protein
MSNSGGRDDDGQECDSMNEDRWRRTSKVVDTAVVLAILVIVIKPEDGPCRENETDDRDRVRL